MAKLYTRRGDGGETVLFDGTTVRKDDLRVEAYGQVDELNAHIGQAASMAAAGAAGPEISVVGERLVEVQRRLLVIGAVLATPDGSRAQAKIPKLAAEDVAVLERWIDEACEGLPPLREFVLPGGRPLACQLHVCRTVCRRAERRVVAFAGHAPMAPHVLVYLNRLGDLLFAWARRANHCSGMAEERWEGSRRMKDEG